MIRIQVKPTYGGKRELAGKTGYLIAKVKPGLWLAQIAPWTRPVLLRTAEIERLP